MRPFELSAHLSHQPYTSCLDQQNDFRENMRVREEENGLLTRSELLPAGRRDHSRGRPRHAVLPLELEVVAVPDHPGPLRAAHLPGVPHDGSAACLSVGGKKRGKHTKVCFELMKHTYRQPILTVLPTNSNRSTNQFIQFRYELFSYEEA